MKHIGEIENMFHIKNKLKQVKVNSPAEEIINPSLGMHTFMQ